MARMSLALIAIVVPLTLAACGGSSSSTSTEAATTTAESSTAASTGPSGGGQSIDISETEYKLTPADSSVNAGKVTLTASNDGTTTHNLVIEGNGISEQSTNSLSPGASGQLSVDLKPGTYEIYCSIDGHRDLGMEGKVTAK